MEFQIKLDVDKIQREFAALQSVIRLSFRERGVTGRDVAAHVIAFGVSQADKKELKTAESLEDVFMLLTDNWSFSDCDLLDSIVEVYGSAEDHGRMVDYQGKLHAFCKRRVSEVPKDIISTCSVFCYHLVKCCLAVN